MLLSFIPSAYLLVKDNHLHHIPVAHLCQVQSSGARAVDAVPSGRQRQSPRQRRGPQEPTPAGEVGHSHRPSGSPHPQLRLVQTARRCNKALPPVGCRHSHARVPSQPRQEREPTRHVSQPGAQATESPARVIKCPSANFAGSRPLRSRTLVHAYDQIYLRLTRAAPAPGIPEKPSRRRQRWPRSIASLQYTYNSGTNRRVSQKLPRTSVLRSFAFLPQQWLALVG